MTPIAYLSPCYGEDGEDLGYVALDRSSTDTIPVVSQSSAEELLSALETLLNLPDFDGTRETSSIRRDAKRRARSLINIYKEKSK